MHSRNIFVHYIDSDGDVIDKIINRRIHKLFMSFNPSISCFHISFMIFQPTLDIIGTFILKDLISISIFLIDDVFAYFRLESRRF